MTRPDNTYSRVVAWLKILLPLLALALLSTLFLVARTVDPAQELLFADVDIEELSREQRISRPRFSAVTTDGAAISLSAQVAHPDPGNPMRVTGSDILADIDLPDGNNIRLSATRVVIDNSIAKAQLDKGVRLVTTDGYVIFTQTVDIALDRIYVASASPTMVTAPIGQLSADRFELSGVSMETGPYDLVFKGHVKLVYDRNE